MPMMCTVKTRAHGQDLSYRAACSGNTNFLCRLAYMPRFSCDISEYAWLL